MKKRVGIFGGSFDPVHCGHIHIACSFLDSGLIEELLVLPAPYPPHKKRKKQTEFKHRLAMLTLAFQGMENVIVSDLEQQLPSPSYTLHTINHLQSEHPETLYYLCIGEDSLQNIHKWYKCQSILEKVDLLVAERPGSSRSKVDPSILEHTIFVEHEPYSISSTSVRNSSGQKMEDLPDSVAEYIRNNHLYQYSN